MTKKLLTNIFILSFILTVNAQCNENEEYKVLLIGDSWAFFMGVDGTFNNVFEQYGHSNYKFFTNPVVAENGARTTDFLEAGKQEEIANLLNTYPSIEVVHLSIGGNDVLGQWDVSFTQAELDDLTDEVYNQVLEIFNFIKATRPGIQIVFSGYCYPNFEEVIESAAPLQTVHPFYGTWEGMGYPNFLQINTILNDFSLLIENYANTDPQVHFHKATGILQYTFGQTSPLGVAPGGTYPPFTLSMPFGDPNYPSPKNSMRDYAITKDCFHLSPKGYRDLIGFTTQKFYQKFLMDDQYLLSTNNQTGGVSSLGNTSASLKLGKESSEDFGVMLNFETSNLFWEGVDEATIFMRIQNVTGQNPLGAPLEISINNGFIGSSASVDGADWSGSVSYTGTPCLFGKKDGPGDWIRIELPDEALEFIKKANATQIRIKSLTGADGSIVFSDASNPEFAPVLNLKFDESYVGIKENIETLSFNLYPNPGQDHLIIATEKERIESVKIYDALGRICLQENGKQLSRVDISSLTKGIYFLEVSSAAGKAGKSFVKD